MEIKLLTLVILWAYGVLAYDYHCSKRSALLLLKRPAYDFSVKLLQRVTEDTDSHFVYSPMSTWLQLTALAEGATGSTFREIWKVTKHHRNRCFRKKLIEILNNLNRDLHYESKRRSVIAMDNLMAVKKSYVREIQKLYGIKVLLLNFNEPIHSATEVNNAIEEGTGGVINRILYYDDFMSTVLLMSDANYFRSEWKTPFNSAYTKLQPFYSSQGVKIGEVSMMNQIGYYHLVDFPLIDAKVLEIPCATSRISMLVFLPTNKGWVGELFYSLQRTRLTSIFNLYKRERALLVNVTLPRFKQRSEIDNLPELVYDMGIKRIFNPALAEFKGISDYKMYASLMTQISDIEISEKGVTAGVSADFLVKNDTCVEFVVNKPFAYMIVDRITEFILFAGVYSVPSVI